MLTIHRTSPDQGGRLTRRRILQAGGAGLFGLSLPRVLAAESAGPFEQPRAKSVIFLFLFGGPSQLETFDMKPEAPSTLRGPFQPVASRTPGLQICEHLSRTAAISDKITVVRSMSHPYNDHSTAGHYIQTGHPWQIPIGGGFNATDKDWPSMGCVVQYLAHQAGLGGAGELPAHIYLPNRMGHLQNYSSKLDRPGQYAGWLGRGFDPLATAIQKKSATDNPYFRPCSDDELDFRIPGTVPPEGLTLERVGQRTALLEQFDAQRGVLQQSRQVDAYDRFQQRALALVTSEKTRNALDIRQEKDSLRDRYGRHLFGQSTLLARRLVEAGTRFVTVGWDCIDGYSWDSHVHSNDVKDYLLPGFDQAFSALITDLDDRGLLDETLVIALGEMGRTPKPSGNWGRSHWSTLFPAVLAGGGIKRGYLYGQSDKDAAYAIEKPTKPEELAATVFHALGISPEARLYDAVGRPNPLVDHADPVFDLFG